MKRNFRKLSLLLLVAILTITTLTSCGATEFSETNNINVVTREEGSGTRDAFVELTGVLVKNDDGTKKDNTTTSATTINSTEAVLTNITDDLHAIGYVSLGSLRESVKALKIDGVVCNAQNIKNSTYSISRPFIIATDGDISDVAEDFINYILSQDGQNIVEEEGYVSISDTTDAYNGEKTSGKITIAGSSSVSPLMEKLKEAYVEVNPNATIEIQTSDSSAGMTAVQEGTCEIGMASRELKESEADLESTVIAKDGIALIVNHSNTADDISLEDARKIYTGEIKTWADITK